MDEQHIANENAPRRRRRAAAQEKAFEAFRIEQELEKELEQKAEQEQRTLIKSEQETETEYVSKEELLEKKLERILRTVDGIGGVQVMITLKSDGQKRVEKDESILLTFGPEYIWLLERK